MDFKLILIVFGSIFIAELGDKTQLATLLFCANKEVSKISIFIGSSAVLICTSLVGVLLSSLLANIINPKVIGLISRIGFTGIGAFTIWASLKTT